MIARLLVHDRRVRAEALAEASRRLRNVGACDPRARYRLAEAADVIDHQAESIAAGVVTGSRAPTASRPTSTAGTCCRASPGAARAGPCGSCCAADDFSPTIPVTSATSRK